MEILICHSQLAAVTEWKTKKNIYIHSKTVTGFWETGRLFYSDQGQQTVHTGIKKTQEQIQTHEHKFPPTVQQMISSNCFDARLQVPCSCAMKCNLMRKEGLVIWNSTAPVNIHWHKHKPSAKETLNLKPASVMMSRKQRNQRHYFN